jgi:hypothetical protein
MENHDQKKDIIDQDEKNLNITDPSTLNLKHYSGSVSGPHGAVNKLQSL